MQLIAFCQGVGLPEAALAAAMDCPPPPLAELGRLLLEHPANFYGQFTDGAGPLRALRAYLELGAAAEAAYQRKGICETVYWDTFRDLTVWCENYYVEHGRYGLGSLSWLAKHLRLELFRLGRLQFEPTALARPLRDGALCLPAGSLALNVHIPQGEPLAREACLDAFARAEGFFRGLPPYLICHSWLLYPGLRDVLPEGSNILAFQSLFTILDVNEEDRQAEERIFSLPYRADRLPEGFLPLQQDPRDYPERTRLQRAAKAHLLSGGRLGSAFGYRRNF